MPLLRLQMLHRRKQSRILQAANEAHQTALDAEQGSTDAAVAALSAAATLAGVEDLAEDASAEDIQTALTAQINVLNGKPGATHTPLDPMMRNQVSSLTSTINPQSTKT